MDTNLETNTQSAVDGACAECAQRARARSAKIAAIIRARELEFEDEYAPTAASYLNSDPIPRLARAA